MAIKDKWKESLYYQSFKGIFWHPKDSLYIILFDVLFFAVAYYVYLLFRNVVPNELTGFSSLNASGIIFGTLAYFAVLLFLYSAFKYVVLGFLKNITLMQNRDTENRNNFTIRKFLDFALLNLALFSGMIFGYLFINIFLGNFIAYDYLGIAALAVLVPFGIFAYMSLNFAHGFFGRDLKIKDILKRTFSGDVLKRAFFAFISMIILFAFYLGVFYIIAIILTQAGTNGRTAAIILSIFTNMAYYLIHFYNRFYTYLSVNKIFASSESKDFE